jgi:hypothetical protein
MSFAFLFAVIISAIATIPIVLGFVAGEPDAPLLLWAYPLYLVGHLSAAFVYWLLQRLGRSATGRYAIGFLCGTCVYLSVTPLVMLLRNEPLEWQDMLIVAYGCGTLVGGPVSLSWEAI